MQLSMRIPRFGARRNRRRSSLSYVGSTRRPRRLHALTTGLRPASDSRSLRIIQWITTIMAVATVVGTIIYNSDLLRIQQETNRNQQQASVTQANLTNRGQITDRFGKAIDQLGQEGLDKIGLRLGGIYALERIMKDSLDDEPAVI